MTMKDGKFVTETERLLIREMTQADLDALCKIMCDEETMRAAYERVFTVEEVQGWLNRHLKRYEDFGCGLWAVVLKETGEMIGQCGLTWQKWRDQEILEIGYLFQKAGPLAQGLRHRSGHRLQRVCVYRYGCQYGIFYDPGHAHGLPESCSPQRDADCRPGQEEVPECGHEFLSVCRGAAGWD